MENPTSGLQIFVSKTSTWPFSPKIQWHKNHAKPTLYVTMVNFQFIFHFMSHYASCHVTSFTLHLTSHDMMFQVVTFFSKLKKNSHHVRHLCHDMK